MFLHLNGMGRERERERERERAGAAILIFNLGIGDPLFPIMHLTYFHFAALQC